MIKKHLVLATLAFGAASSCAPLKEISEYSIASTKTMEDRSLANSFNSSTARITVISGKLGATPKERPESKTLAKIQKTYAAYFDAMGALADGDKDDYAAQYEKFSKALQDSNLASSKKSTAISAVGNLTTSLATSYYRQKKMGEILRETDPVVQKNMASLITICDEFKATLADNSKHIDEHYQIAGRGATPAVELYLKQTLSNHHADIAKEEAQCNAFKEAIGQIADGHHKLTENSQELSASEVKTMIRTHKDRISEAYKALNP